MLVDSCIGEMLIFVSKALEKNLTMVHLAKETAHWLKTKNNRLSLTSVLIINYYVNYFGDELMNRISKELSFLSLDLKTGHHFKLTGKKTKIQANDVSGSGLAHNMSESRQKWWIVAFQCKS